MDILKTMPYLLVQCVILICMAACSNKASPEPPLPNLNVLKQNSRGYRAARVITHDHSPYSWDACDYTRQSDSGSLNQDCLNHLRAAMCENHADFVFLSDHPDNMANHEISDLLLLQNGDTLTDSDGLPSVNQMKPCSDGFSPSYAVGYENSNGLMALGMTQHLDPSVTVRGDLYTQQTLAVRNQLIQQADALVVIPHTESQTISAIEAVQPDAIEIYNIHANVDPKIRMNYLGLNPFSAVISIASYAIDPYHQTNADFAFMSFYQIAPVYFNKWNQLISDQYFVTGLAGTDAHENIPGLTDSNGERLDSHRRMMRFASNYVMVNSMDVDTVKTAIRSGRTSFVVEGLAVPSGMDYYATGGSSVYEIGQSVSLSSSNGSVVLTAKMPSIQGGIPEGAQNPNIRMELRQVLTGGNDQVVASSNSGDMSYTVNQPGAFRVQVYIVPKHLKIYLGSMSSLADLEFSWIVTNHIYITP